MLAVVLAAHAAEPVATAPPPVASSQPELAGSAHHDSALVAQGRRLYLDGERADGSLYAGRRADGSRIEAAAAACVNCHRRSAQGGIEGSLLIPPVTAATLYRDGLFAAHAGVATDPRAPLEPRYLVRHAYDRRLLARALREGLDSDGRVLADPMPRFDFDDGEVAALAAWLESRSAGDSGIGAQGPRFWVVTTATADPARVDAVRAVVRAFAADVLAPAPPWQLRWFDLARDPQALERALADGSPRPLALLSGAAGEDWGPVAALCEREELPCLLPSLASPPAAPAALVRQYSLYLSDGLAAEAAALAQAVASDPHPDCRAAALVALPEAGGSELAQLRAALPQARRMTPAEAARQPPGCAIAWLPPAPLAALLATVPPPVDARWYLPAGLLGLAAPVLPAAWKSALRVATTLDVETPLRERTELAPWLARHHLDGLDERAAADALAACALAETALGLVEGERLQGMRDGTPNRDEFVEALTEAGRGLRQPLVVHYSDLSFGLVAHTLTHGVHWLAWPGPEAPAPRPVAAP